MCEKDSYFLELSAYIHVNPSQARLVKDPISYRWSNYRSYVREEKGNLVERDLLLTQFSAKKKAAAKQYEYFVNARIYAVVSLGEIGRLDAFSAVPDLIQVLGEDWEIRNIAAKRKLQFNTEKALIKITGQDYGKNQEL